MVPGLCGIFCRLICAPCACINHQHHISWPEVFHYCWYCYCLTIHSYWWSCCRYWRWRWRWWWCCGWLLLHVPAKTLCASLICLLDGLTVRAKLCPSNKWVAQNERRSKSHSHLTGSFERLPILYPFFHTQMINLTANGEHSAPFVFAFIHILFIISIGIHHFDARSLSLSFPLFDQMMNMNFNKHCNTQ